MNNTEGIIAEGKRFCRKHYEGMVAEQSPYHRAKIAFMLIVRGKAVELRWFPLGDVINAG